MRNLIGSLLLTVVILYGMIAAFTWLFAERMIFQPPPASYQNSEKIISIPSGDTEIAAIYLPNKSARYTILYSHGNAVDLGGVYPMLEQLKNMGFSVFAYDYRGYGTSGGTPSEQHVYQDIDAAYIHLTQKIDIPPDRIIALGQSLGGGVATDLASRKPLGGLILESAFTTAYRVMTRIPLLPFDQFDTLSKLEKIDCPVLVIHGRNDSVISFSHGKELFSKANEPKQKLWVDGAGHNNLLSVAGKKYGQALGDFLRLIKKN